MANITRTSTNSTNSAIFVVTQYDNAWWHFAKSRPIQPYTHTIVYIIFFIHTNSNDFLLLVRPKYSKFHIMCLNDCECGEWMRAYREKYHVGYYDNQQKKKAGAGTTTIIRRNSTESTATINFRVLV